MLLPAHLQVLGQAVIAASTGVVLPRKRCRVICAGPVLGAGTLGACHVDQKGEYAVADTFGSLAGLAVVGLAS